MYISQISIKNFRNFKDQTIEFNEGVNVIVGHNNAGKTNLLKALSLVIDYQGSKRLDIDDFNKLLTLEDLKANPPKISIAVAISKGGIEEVDDLVTVGNWLIKLDSSYEALLTYEFYLPEKEKADYLTAISSIPADDPQKALDEAWRIIKHDFLRLFVYKIWGGDIKNQNVAEGESLQKFDFQFLDAIRDVERDMLTGRNTLLRDVLDFFMDFEIKSHGETSKEQKESAIKNKKLAFSDQAGALIETLQARMKKGKEQILSYAEETGAAFNKAKPNFEGSLSDVELFSVLKLILEHETGIKIPATHNGLGYNNLIFMSLLLAKMQVNSDGKYLGSNAKVFSVLAIEEPEAHLHPAMQYKFLKFLKENKDKKKVRQIFVTTHSTHITSAVSLDEIICLHNENGDTIIGYPGKVFPDEKSKKFVQRFLDATKSDMLFAQKVILVEGLAEQLLMSILARYSNKLLENDHIAVINVGGRYFDHFLHLFDSNKPHTIPKKIACLTDRDPERKISSGAGEKFKKCYPFEYNNDVHNYEYKDNASKKILLYATHPNIRFFSQSSRVGKTFEYDIVLHNPSCELLVTSSMSNQDEIKAMMGLFADPETRSLSEFYSLLTSGSENDRLRSGIDANTLWSEEDKKKAVIAARYLNSVQKGENALELAYELEFNLQMKEEKPEDFVELEVPEYINQAFDWICQ